LLQETRWAWGLSYKVMINVAYPVEICSAILIANAPYLEMKMGYIQETGVKR
jgi:hypothetical protein